jgi:hypothetical protein
VPRNFRIDRSPRRSFLRLNRGCADAGRLRVGFGGSGRIVTRYSSPATSMTAATATPNMASTRSYGSSIAFERNSMWSRPEPSPLAIRASA